MPSPSPNPAAGLARSHTHWKILALLTLISVITYVDRVNISVAARGVNAGRSWVGCAGMLLSGACIVAGTQIAEPYTAITLLSLGAGFLYFTVGAFWASTIDLAPRHAGTLSGIMNTFANVGGTIWPTLTPWLAEQFGWNVSLGFAAAVAALGGLLWLLVKPGDGLRK